MFYEIFMTYCSIVSINYAVSVEGPVVCNSLIVHKKSFYSLGFRNISVKLKKVIKTVLDRECRKCLS